MSLVAFIKWVSTRVATVFGVLGILVAHSYASTEVKHVVVDSQFMKFPQIPLKGIQYSALLFEYATEGTVVITSIDERTELGRCGASGYLHVEHSGPKVVFRVFDGSRKKTLVQRYIDTSGSSDFGKGECRSHSDLRVDFEKSKGKWLAAEEKRLLSDARRRMNTFIDKDAAMSYEDIRFPLFFVAADGSRFNRLNQAFDRARKAFDLYLQFGITIDAQATLREVTQEWEAILNDLKYRSNTNSHDKKIIMALHRNLSISHFFLTQFDEARRHDALAISHGMLERESLQPLILENEQRFIYSPTVSKDLVLMANLYRFGSNVVKGARLQQADISTFKLN